ncbi:hypothetical protein NOV72_01561 [Caballeronia novacaledonica]|uniref:Uncharacterized protein n=2 Tax=Caballeronia novacaledonica TaxID=1544861 RepID=A0A2U3I2L5_9BURK|nr:hypothetical protein NOV72_01561 [Caballeronia novacaledonica]
MDQDDLKKANTRRIRAAGTARTWDDENVRRKRITRHTCTVTCNGVTTEHDSVHAGFKAYGLPTGSHISFRSRAKIDGMATLEHEGLTYLFKTFPKDSNIVPTPSEPKASQQLKGGNLKGDEQTADEQLAIVYGVMMHAAGTGLFNATKARAIYSHVMASKLKMQLRTFTGKVSRAAAADPEAKLILEHFHRIQHRLTLLVADHMKSGPDVAAFIEAVRRMEQVHIVTFEENYAAHRAKGCYDAAGIELLDWVDLPEDVRRTLYNRKLKGSVSNAKQYAV